MLGEYIVGPQVAPVAADAASIGVGIGVVSSDAVSAGASALPDPNGEADYPWLYWAQHDFFFGSTATDPASLASSLRRPFDIKSMRKLKPRESLVAVIQYSDISGAPPLHVEFTQTRVLVAT